MKSVSTCAGVKPPYFSKLSFEAAFCTSLYPAPTVAFCATTVSFESRPVIQTCRPSSLTVPVTLLPRFQSRFAPGLGRFSRLLCQFGGYPTSSKHWLLSCPIFWQWVHLGRLSGTRLLLVALNTAPSHGGFVLHASGQDVLSFLPKYHGVDFV